jgi:putative toxin-antitoxin system antitoxin component (TIGR02293 family)
VFAATEHIGCFAAPAFLGGYLRLARASLLNRSRDSPNGVYLTPHGVLGPIMSDSVERVLSYLGEKAIPKAEPKRKAKKTDKSPAGAGAAAVRKSVKPSGRGFRIRGEIHDTLRSPMISINAVGRLAEKLDVSDYVILHVSDISERTFQRRKEKHEPLSATESDRVLRIARVAEKAEKVFGNPDKARRWLSSPSRMLGAKPLDLLATDVGAREVEDELVRIDFGDFA